MPNKLTTEDWINKSNIKHNHFYIYDKSIYINARKKIIITCPFHGNFEQLPSQHLFGKGCLKCSSTRAKTNEEFIFDAINKHKTKYDYSLIEYKNSHTKVKIICPEHGEFKQTPTCHLSGQGCPKCGKLTLSKIALKNSYGWSLTDWLNKVNNTKNAKPMFYVLKCYNINEEFIKIGITMRDIKKRYPSNLSMPYKYEILKIFNSTGENVFKLEKLIIKTFKNHKYSPNIKFNGSGECYEINILTKIISYI